jgi:Uma2 family endonuclease
MEKIRELPRHEQRIHMSYEEYLSRFDESSHVEWVNGEAIVFMPPSMRHQEVSAFLIALLANFVGYFRLGKVYRAPTAMKLSPSGSSREPDILFVANEHLHRVQENRLLGPADLVVELISPESIARDRVEKFQEYQSAGVREYWIIDIRPGYEHAAFWGLDQSGRFQRVPVGDDNIYRCAMIPNFWFNVTWLWQEETRDAVRAFDRIIGR